MIKKYPHHSDLIFCRVPFLHTFPDNILDKYIRFTITQHLSSTVAVLNLKRSGQYTGYGERKKKNLKLQTVPPQILLSK